jgi:HD-GYP domain-containing protein (c-di-GMP phosphodiesterase class II)
MLQGVEFDGNVAETIRQAHERWDGEGEPRVLKGEAILESAWVVAVADAFTGVISARAHRPGLSLDKAEEIIASLAGTSLDRKPVTALLFQLENGGGCGDWGALLCRQPLRSSYISRTNRIPML